MTTGLFYGKEIRVQKESLDYKGLMDAFNLLKAGEEDYFVAKTLLKSSHIPNFITTSQQCFEKISKFIAYYIFEKEEVRTHKSKNLFSLLPMLEHIPEEYKSEARIICDHFIDVRYFENHPDINFSKVNDFLDSFILESWRFLYSIGAGDYFRGLDMMLPKLYGTSIQRLLYVVRFRNLETIDDDVVKEKMSMQFELVSYQNKLINEYIEFFDGLKSNISLTFKATEHSSVAHIKFPKGTKLDDILPNLKKQGFIRL